MSIGLFYGTTTGKTSDIAEMIRDEFGTSLVTLHDISESKKGDLSGYDHLIIGCPTWDIGELQSDWDDFFPNLDDLNFAGKKVAYFGTGDQVGYADNFQDAMGILEEKISGRGGVTVGFWPTQGYDHSASKALKNGKFIGLAIDEDNQPELTQQRVKAWVAQLKNDFGL
jgi:flavodoxin I